MSQAIAENYMASDAKKGRVEFQAPVSWIDRAEQTAESLGLSLSAYIRLLVTQDMERLERERGGTNAKPKRKP
jgi:hypothetical protein